MSSSDSTAIGTRLREGLPGHERETGVLSGRDLWLSYGNGWVLGGVDIEIEVGEVAGLWGPSGCGKSTLGRVLSGRIRPQRGSVQAPPKVGRARSVQLVLQHSELAMNPRWKISQVLAEAADDPSDVLDSGLVRREWFSAFPHELSGGELQRVNLARALLARPRFVVADEITASLDAITQAQIWQILLAGAREGRYGVLAISHDAPLLEHVASRVVAMEEINRA